MKEINCTFSMNGTYCMDEKSVYSARQKALNALFLPEGCDYVNGSFVVPDLKECMMANGWSEDEVDELSKLSADTLIKMIEEQSGITPPSTPDLMKKFFSNYKNALRKTLDPSHEPEKLPAPRYAVARLKEFLLDYYGVEYVSGEKKEEEVNPEVKENQCFIVVQSKIEDGTKYFVFTSNDAAVNYIRNEANSVAENLKRRNRQAEVSFYPNGNADLYVPNFNIRYHWTICPSVAVFQDSPVSAGDSSTTGDSSDYRATDEKSVLKNTSGIHDGEVTERELPAEMCVHTPLGDIIVRTDPLAVCGVFVDLRRPESDQDMSLMSLCFLQNEDDGDKGYLEAVIDGEGKKDQLSERTVFDGVEDFFRLT